MKKIKILIIILLIILIIPFIINFYVIFKTKEKVFSSKDINKKYDIALVLGCSVINNETPSKMLKDRLDMAIYLYENNLVEYILISGDHNEKYSEVEVMKKYLIENNIKEDSILTDYIGYSTHESLINYKNNYKDKSVLIITQKYHLYRALFISKNLDINGIGIYAKDIKYKGYLYHEIREILARNKDFLLFTFLKRS